MVNDGNAKDEIAQAPVDELFGTANPALMAETSAFSETNSQRHVNFILDHTAFTQGIGNIKRWFNPDYVKSECQVETPLLNLFVPNYTLHEFDYVKRGTTMTATNAREAIALIDKISEGVADAPLRYSVQFETPNHQSGFWDACLKYQVHKPVIGDFPNYRTQFGLSIMGRPRKEATHENISYENSESYQNALAHADEPAQMPSRLRYIIQPCIQLVFNSPNSAWTLVTEDAITRIWAQSFGIPCMNITEAELLLFRGYDVNNLRKFDPNRTVLDEIRPNSILQETVDTSAYPYRHVRLSRPKRAKGRENALHHATPATSSVRNTHGVHREKYDHINHAPRGAGQLWEPGQ